MRDKRLFACTVQELFGLACDITPLSVRALPGFRRALGA
jgi:hypothetical protein